VDYAKLLFVDGKEADCKVRGAGEAGGAGEEEYNDHICSDPLNNLFSGSPSYLNTVQLRLKFGVCEVRKSS